jgi:NhaP-type Na+/H+ or K+/H+ antiporter
MTFASYSALAVFLYALVARRLSVTPFSAAMVFTLAGILAGSQTLDLVKARSTEGDLEILLEVTLVLVLFSDAFAARHWDPRRDRMPIRLLAIGMPLTIALGALIGKVMFPQLDVWEAAALGAILAPTDAALGSAVVTDQRLPNRIRQTLNVESGLNDGLSLPFLAIFVILAGEAAGLRDAAPIERFLRAIILSGGIGIVMAWVGSRMLMWARARGWTSDVWVRIGFLAIAVAVFAVADRFEGSGFIAAWIGGFVSGRTVGRDLEEPTEFLEGAGSLLMLIAFLAFGAIMVAPLWDGFRWEYALYGAFSLTFVRMTSVAISLVGTRLRPRTVLFMGWFGPRGLASLVFVLLLLPQELPGQADIVGAVTTTVLMSIVLHGMSAVTGVGRYARWFERTSEASHDLVESGDSAEPLPRRRLLSAER